MWRQTPILVYESSLPKGDRLLILSGLLSRHILLYCLILHFIVLFDSPSHLSLLCVCVCVCVCVISLIVCLAVCMGENVYTPLPNPCAVNRHALAWIFKIFFYVHYKLSFIPFAKR